MKDKIKKGEKEICRSTSELYEYISKGIRFSKPLTIKQIKTIFVVALYYYINGHTDEYKLEAITSDLFFNLSKSPNYIKSKDIDLSNALDCASDLTYYFGRKNKNPESRKRVEEIMRTLNKYYEKNKNLLKKPNEL